MTLSPAYTILFFACVFIAFALVIVADDIIRARARKRRDARRERCRRISEYRMSRTPEWPLLPPENVVDLEQWTRKVGA